MFKTFETLSLDHDTMKANQIGDFGSTRLDLVVAIYQEDNCSLIHAEFDLICTL